MEKKKIKKYRTEADKWSNRISPEYAKHLQEKYLRKRWDKKLEVKVLMTLPKRLAERYSFYDFSKMPEQKLNSMYIYGDVGTGKTVASAFYFVEFVRELYLQQGTFSNLAYHFVVFSKMIDELQRDYKDSENLIQKYSQCDLLVLDEFGAKKLTEYVYDLVYLIVNERYLSCLPTIINSNHTLAEIGQKFVDERIVRRIEEDYLLIEKLNFK